MRDALNKTGRPIVYAIDDWGVTNPWQYGMEVSPHSFCVMAAEVMNPHSAP